jgi:hypothetical protein
MTPERARDILPIIQAHAEGKPVYLIMRNSLGEIVYHKCARNIRFDHGSFVLEIPGQTGKTVKEVVLQNAADSLDSMIELGETYSKHHDAMGCNAPLCEDVETAKKSLDDLRKEFKLD